MSKLIPIFVLLLLTLMAVWALLTNSFYTSHDGFTHTARIASYTHALEDGQFPPRWGSNLMGNMGSSIFTYIYPIPYMMGSASHFVGFSYQDSYRLVMIISTLAAGLLMYLWLKEMFGTEASLVGAVAYIWVPYRFLNLYVRGAYAENLGYTLVPLVLLCIHRIIKNKNLLVWVPLLALSTGFLMLSHNVVAAMTIPIAFGWLLINSYLAKNFKAVIWSILGWMGAFAIASFIYLPDFLERQFVAYDKGISYYQEHYVAWWQLIRSPWGYGFDFPGTVQDAMSLQLGLIHWGILVASVILVIFLFLKHKKIKKRASLLPVTFFILLVALLIFLMVDSPLVLPVWKSLPLITTIIDFPWRFLGIIALATAFLAAFLINSLPKKGLVAAILVVALLVVNRNHTRINEAQYFDDAVFDNYTGTSTATSNEFNSAWHTTQHYTDRQSPVEFLKGNGQLSNMSSTAQGSSVDVTVSEPATIRFNRFYFPQTDIYKDNKLLVKDKDYLVIYEITNDEDDDTGLIKIPITPPGGHYELRFTETPVRAVGNFITTASFGVVTLLLLYGLVKLSKAKKR